MKYLDLSFEGRQLAERNQLDNGKLPHGGYRGSKKYPPCHLSYDKGREFQHKIDQEVERILEEEEVLQHGPSPSWSVLLHREPSYTDESPLITRNLLAASRHEPINGVTLYNRNSLLPNKCAKPLKNNGVTYYRPNRMHQYLSSTELKNKQEEFNIKYGRPTRTTLLRARQRSNSAPTNSYEKRREYVHRMEDIKSASPAPSPSPEYLQLDKARDGESLHSYLTGARYNRAHCLDSKSVDHNGVYMPRNNPALGSFFTGPKGQEYLQEFVDSPRLDLPSPHTPTTPKSARRRPLTAPPPSTRAISSRSQSARSVWRENQSVGQENSHPVSRPKYRHLKLNVIGNRLPIGLNKDTNLRLPSLQRPHSARRPQNAVEETYRVNQPPPTPSSIAPPKETQEEDSKRSTTSAVTNENDKNDAIVARGSENMDVAKDEMVDERAEARGEEKESNIQQVPEAQISVPDIVNEEQDERSEVKADEDQKTEEKEEQYQVVVEEPAEERARADEVIEETAVEGKEEEKNEQEKNELETTTENQINDVTEKVDVSTPEKDKPEDETTKQNVDETGTNGYEEKVDSAVDEVKDTEEETKEVVDDNEMETGNTFDEEKTPSEISEAEQDVTKKEVRFFLTEDGGEIKTGDIDESNDDKNRVNNSDDFDHQENVVEEGTQKDADL